MTAQLISVQRLNVTSISVDRGWLNRFSMQVSPAGSERTDHVEGIGEGIH